MKLPQLPLHYQIALGLGGALVVYVGYRIWKFGLAKTIDDAVSAPVIAAGKVLGVPETDEAKCQAAISAGDRWEQSKYCTAGTFIRNVTGRSTPEEVRENTSLENRYPRPSTSSDNMLDVTDEPTPFNVGA